MIITTKTELPQHVVKKLIFLARVYAQLLELAVQMRTL